jgi:uncharacterized protein (DUF58 family)
MDLWTQILTIPGMGGILAVSVIALWVLFLALMIAWIARTPQDSK